MKGGALGSCRNVGEGSGGEEGQYGESKFRVFEGRAGVCSLMGCVCVVALRLRYWAC